MAEFGQANKKPVKVDYYVWDSQLLILDEWVQSFGQKLLDNFTDMDIDHSIKVKTLEGTSYNVPLGYIIIRGVEGEYYPCEPTIFSKTYETLITNKKED